MTYQKIYKYLVLNNLIFLILSFLFYQAKLSDVINLIPSTIFLIGSGVITFSFFVQNYSLVLITWFAFATFLYVGIGTFASLYKFSYLKLDDNILANMSNIDEVNMLNSLSIFIIVFISYLINLNNIKHISNSVKSKDIVLISNKLVTLIIFILFSIIAIKISYYSIFNNNIIINSILQKITFFEDGMIIILAIKFLSLSSRYRIYIIIYFILALIFSSLSLSSFIFLKTCLAICIGFFLFQENKKGIFLVFILMMLSYLLYNPTKLAMRSHNLFISNQIAFKDKLTILSDSLLLTYGSEEQSKSISYNFYKIKILNRFAQPAYFMKFNNNKYSKEDYTRMRKEIFDYIISYPNDRFSIENLAKKISNHKFSFNINLNNKFNKSDIKLKNEIIKKVKIKNLSPINYIYGIFNRLDVVSIQRFIINEYNIGNKGSTLNNLHYFFIPRIIWKEKPSIQNYGIFLNKIFYDYNNLTDISPSSLAPSFAAEAYWNHGYLGVIIISIFYGAVLGVLNSLFNKEAHIHYTIPYIMILIPSIKWTMFYESWIGISIIGEIIIIIVIYCLTRLSLKCFSKIISYKLKDVK
tara:strand:- start:6949 stop:8694 length:1746 start_codon:yes stop_codon:yes gene_type:complete